VPAGRAVAPFGLTGAQGKIDALWRRIKWRLLDFGSNITYILYNMYKKSEETTSGLSVSEARADFADTLRRVADRGERVRLSRSGKEVAAMVPIADLELLEALEDRADLEAVREALKSGRRIPYSEARKKLGL